MGKAGVTIGILIGFLLFTIYSLNSVGGSYGQHTGLVTAVEHHVNILWDSDIVYFKSSDESTQEDRYCVNDASVKRQLEEYAKVKKTVTISYSNPFFTWKWQCRDNGISIINSVSP